MSDDAAGPDGAGVSEGLGADLERAAFERWAAVNGYALRRDDGNPERYHAWVTNTLWNGWSARAGKQDDELRSAASAAIQLLTNDKEHPAFEWTACEVVARLRWALNESAPVLVGWVETNGDVIWQDRAAAIGRNLYVARQAPAHNAI